uniref:NADH-ubiquinone oxidoreductase chain 6 n=1 Tax=Lepidogalaxias salamandroides TaxID=89578 RepID=F1AWG1_9TELE|nr:NADH dehydrogenase subunit 6 [Lepidogalaxias salamandroides]
MMLLSTCLFISLLVVGFIGVASNPSPYYGVLNLVFTAGFGAAVIVSYGGSFLSLVLFLIYLGGMLVVFAYSVALYTESYPKAWGMWSVVYGFFVLLVIVPFVFHGLQYCIGVYEGFLLVHSNEAGAGVLYNVAGWQLLLGGWVILLALFAVMVVLHTMYLVPYRGFKG